MAPQDRFDALHQQHYDPIARYLVAWRRRDHLPHDREVLPWLYEVARRVAANERRRQDRYTQLAQRLAAHRDYPTTGLEPEQLDVAAAFDHLTADDQELLLLSAWDGLGVGQIAALRPTPPRTVRQPKGVL
ncbi:RNA polymerase sigma factor [Streptoalloteichus hindustanus]|uniref:Uncharacterized protein n=1 Tax=Streptoalloteichus hindustanus TaxID=2017 RepID=A0A1M5D6Z0_STRHI|nr:sigma-70 family RNA polymerase sigma factor [Streptoalloteichus hindustanus]SHF62452.1 hypothetical protein SAMN05444320_104315 [Streptoalloteichus hindustanus]